MGFFRGVNLRSRDVLGFCWKPSGFGGVLIFAPFDHPRHLKYAAPPLAFKPDLTSLVPVKHPYFYLDYLKNPVEPICFSHGGWIN